MPLIDRAGLANRPRDRVVPGVATINPMGFDRRPKKLGPEALYEYALGALGRRSLTESELRRKLYTRATRPEDIDEIIGRIRSLGYLDDVRVAESHVNFRKEFDALGSRRVFSELRRRRGVDSETAKRPWPKPLRPGPTRASRSVVISSASSPRRLDKFIDDPKEVARLTRTLMRAGFSSGKIVEALQKVAADPGWLDGVEDPEPLDLESP